MEDIMKFFTLLFAIWTLCTDNTSLAQDMPITMTVTPGILDTSSGDTPLFIGCSAAPGNHQYARSLEIKKQNSIGEWVTIASISKQSPTHPEKYVTKEPTVSTAEVSGQIQGKGSFSLSLQWSRTPAAAVGHYECVLTVTSFSQFIVSGSVDGSTPVVGK